MTYPGISLITYHGLAVSLKNGINSINL